MNGRLASQRRLAQIACRLADVPHQLGARLRVAMHARHPLLAHAVGQKDIAFVGAVPALRHEIAAEGMDVDAAPCAVRECALRFVELAFINGEPMPVEVDRG